MSLAPDRARLEADWRRLTGVLLPQAARSAGRNWPVRADHCFARILLDVVCDAPWRSVVAPPACRHLPTRRLEDAVRLGRAVLAGTADLAALNRRSLQLRRQAQPRPR